MQQCETQTGGVYVPPFRRRQQAEKEREPRSADDATREYQQMHWDALRCTLMGIVNRTTIDTVSFTVKEALRENLIRGRGLFCRALMRAQAHSPELSPVLAALVAAVNSKVPAVGELLVKRLIVQFKRCYKRRDDSMSASAKFLAHLAAHRVVPEMLVLKMLSVLLCGEAPSKNDIKVACDIFRVSFPFLQERVPVAFNVIMDPIRELISEGKLPIQSDALLERLLRDVRNWQLQKDVVPAIPPSLDLVPLEEVVTHDVDIDADVNPETNLDVFSVDPDFESHEAEYEALLASFGLELDDADEGEEDQQVERDLDPAPDDAPPTALNATFAAASRDLTSEQLDALRREVDLLMQSSIRAEETAHKILKHVPVGRESIVVDMVAAAALRQRTYDPRLGALAEILCHTSQYQALFEQLFTTVLNTVDDLDSKSIDIYGRFFAQLLQRHAMQWRVLSPIRLTPETTTVYSRRLIRVLLQELGELMTVRALKDTVTHVEIRPFVAGLFCRDTVESAKFVVDFFEEISADRAVVDLRPLVAELREWVESRLHSSDTKRHRQES